MSVSWSQPSHPGVIRVINQPGAFSSYAVSDGEFPVGALLARLTAPGLTLSSRAYSSVQVGPKQTDNVELNCDFLFINHSCEPSIEFHILNSDLLASAKSDGDHDIVIEIRVASRVDENGAQFGLRKGELVSFFYPSTEWDMAQPFNCLCRTKQCKGMIRGAKSLDAAELKQYFINEHIWELKEKQEKDGIEGSCSASASASASVETNDSLF